MHGERQRDSRKSCTSPDGLGAQSGAAHTALVPTTELINGRVTRRLSFLTPRRPAGRPGAGGAPGAGEFTLVTNSALAAGAWTAPGGSGAFAGPDDAHYAVLAPDGVAGARPRPSPGRARRTKIKVFARVKASWRSCSNCAPDSGMLLAP